MEKNVKPRLASATSIYMLVDLDISICRCLVRYGVTTVGQLVRLSLHDLLNIRGIGQKRAHEVLAALDFYEVVNTDNDFWRG